MKYKTKAIIYVVLIALFICDVTAQDFNGSWGTDQSNYYLTIDNENFVSYKFVPYEDEDGCLNWNKVLSPGAEKFVKKEDNVIVTNYWIDEQKYYVKAGGKVEAITKKYNISDKQLSELKTL